MYEEERSHVGMGHSLCPVCGVKHDEVVLLDPRLRKTLTRGMVRGWDMCPEHKKLEADGYIALIGVKNEPKDLNSADRTGDIAHVRRSAWSNVFDTDPPKGPLAFVDVAAFAKLKGMVPHE